MYIKIYMHLKLDEFICFVEESTLYLRTNIQPILLNCILFWKIYLKRVIDLSSRMHNSYLWGIDPPGGSISIIYFCNFNSIFCLFESIQLITIAMLMPHHMVMFFNQVSLGFWEFYHKYIITLIVPHIPHFLQVHINYISMFSYIYTVYFIFFHVYLTS